MRRLFYKAAFFLIFLLLLPEILPAENWDDPPVMRQKRLQMVKDQIEARAVNGVSSVLIAVISEYIASAMGIDILILAGIVSYLVVFSLLYLILTGRRISPPC